MQNGWEQNPILREDNGRKGLTRRDLFGVAGMALATTAVPLPLFVTSSAPNGPSAADPAPSGVSETMKTLSAYMSDAGSHPLPEKVVQATKDHILDTFAAMISGSRLLPGRKAIQFVRAYGGKPVSTVVATEILCGPIEAAQTNAMMAHADETDDSASAAKCHPGCGVIPAALAIGEQFGTSGTRFIRAVALGYDIGNRVTLTLGGRQFELERHWSTHTIAPLFGASAACGCIAGFDAHLMRLMLGYAAQQSSGLNAWDRDPQHIQKAFAFGGMGALGGIRSALLVHEGWTGVEDIFSGSDNFFDAYNPRANPEGLIDKLGDSYQIMLTDIKKWPAGSPVQAVLDAIVNVRKTHPFTADQVQEVTVQIATSLEMIVNDREIPDINVQYLVAIMLLDGTVTFQSANDIARMKTDAVLRERAKVKLLPSKELQLMLPTRGAIVEITLTDGKHLTERVNQVRGSFMNPVTSEEVAAKAHDLVTPVLGETRTSALIEKVLELETISDIRELRPLLQTA